MTLSVDFKVTFVIFCLFLKNYATESYSVLCHQSNDGGRGLSCRHIWANPCLNWIETNNYSTVNTATHLYSSLRPISAFSVMLNYWYSLLLVTVISDTNK